MSQQAFTDFYPWQTKAAQQWLAHRERFSHAWLIHGLAGIGKERFARAGAASLLCTSPKKGYQACGECDACRWCKNGNHPDLRLLRPESVAAQEAAESNPADSKKALSKE